MADNTKSEIRPVATRFARNAEQLVRAGQGGLLGDAAAHLSLAPRKRKRAIAEVNEWLAAADFPEKTRHGWALDEVKQWLAIAKNGRGTSNAEHRTLNIELPIDPNGGPAGELFPAQGDGLKESLDLWEDKLKNPLKWAEAAIQKWQIDFLKQYRPHLFPGSARVSASPMSGVGGVSPEGSTAGSQGSTESRPTSDLSDCESQKALALRLARHFQGRVTIDISEQQISRWKNGEALAGGVQAPLPPAKLGNRFDTRAWSEWIERYIVPKYGRQVNPQGLLAPSVFDRANEAEAQMKIDRARAEAINLAVLEGKYIEVAAVERMAAGLAREYHELWKARTERDLIALRRAKLKGLGLEELKIEEFAEWDTEQERAFLAEVETRCEKQAVEFGRLVTTDGRG